MITGLFLLFSTAPSLDRVFCLMSFPFAESWNLHIGNSNWLFPLMCSTFLYPDGERNSRNILQMTIAGNGLTEKGTSQMGRRNNNQGQTPRFFTLFPIGLSILRSAHICNRAYGNDAYWIPMVNRNRLIIRMISPLIMVACMLLLKKSTWNVIASEAGISWVWWALAPQSWLHRGHGKSGMTKKSVM